MVKDNGECKFSELLFVQMAGEQPDNEKQECLCSSDGRYYIMFMIGGIEILMEYPDRDSSVELRGTQTV